MTELRDDPVFKRHVGRLRSSLSAHGHAVISKFLTEHTYLRGEKFSYRGHEYQRRILEDQSQDIVIIKSAQLGISEMSARLALARAVLVNGFSTIYTLPSAMAAQNFMRTRIDPIIQSSPYLSELVHRTTDNATVKRFGDSYMYLKGAQVDSQAISLPADLCIMDEVNNSSQDVLTLFESRLIHSAYRMTVKLSTPTIPNYGIDVAYQQSRRHMNMCKCVHCNEWFYPSYFDHVKVPDFDQDLDQVTKQHFANPKFRWQDAYVGCPKCGLAVDLADEHREWVCENPNDTFIAAGYRVSPFDCVEVIKPSAIVKSSVDYERKQDFYNQRLGMSLEDSESTLMADELWKAIISEYPGGGFSYVMGLDLGTVCHAVVAAVLPDNTLIVVHTETIPLFQVIQRRKELAMRFRVRMSCCDHGPYTESVYRMQQEDANLFAGVYTNSKAVDLFKVREVEEDAEKGQQAAKQVNIARDRVFDLIMMMLRNGNILKVSDANDQLWVDHLMDQKRVREFVKDTLVFVWRKTQGRDHFHHALLYTLVASRMLGVASGSGIALPFLVSSFRQKSEEEKATDRRRF